jgi:hypothetical protein
MEDKVSELITIKNSIMTGIFIIVDAMNNFF